MSTLNNTRLPELENGKALKSNETGIQSRTLAEAEAEIERLRLELEQAHEELDSLTEVTSGFVRLMI
jgi:hypothetical protein